MDCRYSHSDGMTQLRHSVGTTCASLGKMLSVSINAHMFLVYLLDKFGGVVAVTLEEIQSRIDSDLLQDQPKKIDELLSFIPTTQTHLIEICYQLSDKGHLLFLQNATSVKDSIVIIDRTALFEKVNGTIFAPPEFDQHVSELARGTGVVSRSKLAELFSKLKINIDMLVGFMSYLELGIPINDTIVLRLIHQHVSQTSEQAILPGESYIFLPALIRLEAPEGVRVFQSQCSYHFGWLLFCSEPSQFFDIRLFQVLQLRLALSLDFAPAVGTNLPDIQCHCSIWKTGIRWSTRQGCSVLVELVNNKRNVVVLVQSHDLSPDCLRLRTSVVQRVLQTAKDLCSSVDTHELFLPLSSLAYPFNTFQETKLYSLTSIALSIVKCDHYVVSMSGIQHTPVNDLVQGEVYTDLGESILQLVFNDSCPEYTQKVSDHFVSALVNQVMKAPGKAEQMVKILLSQCPKSTSLDQTTPTGGNEVLDVVVKRWRDESDGTYCSLREALDPYSVFAGRSPLELAGVPLKPFSEVSLPDPKPNSDMATCSLSDLNLDNVDHTTVLDEDDIATITGELSELESQYDTLALNLHLSHGTVSRISRDYQSSCKSALGQVIVEWLQMNYNYTKFGRPSWRGLVEAVNRIDHQIARNIADNHLTPSKI